jgi:FkbM family methyltransferase
MNEIIKYWDENLIEKHIGIEMNWLDNYLTNHKYETISYIDIGANVGKFYDSLSKKYFIKKCIMVEPSKILYTYMDEKFKNNNNIEIHNFAISDVDGFFDFHDSASNGVEYWKNKSPEEFDSMNLGLSKLDLNNSGGVKCYSMYNFLKKVITINPQEITFIKIDTENYDLKIIKSMTQFFLESKINPFILFENNYHNNMTDFEAENIVKEFCEMCGYIMPDLKRSGDHFLMPI